MKLYVMRAIKGGWIRQTFSTLAKCNEPGVKKSGIRRSKEERKAMVETYIKRYQSLNNGTFPSLSLTQKEVGGSYYVIREIFHRVIQENRVLSHAKLTPKQQNIDKSRKQYALGSNAAEPKTYYEKHYISNLDGTGEELILDADVLPTESEHRPPDIRKIVDGSEVYIQNKESDELALKDMQISEPIEEGNSTEELVAPTVELTPIVADVMIETFPLRPVNKQTDSLGGKSRESGTLMEIVDLEEEDIKKSDLGHTNGSSVMEGVNLPKNSGFVDQKVVVNLRDPLLKSNSDSAENEAVKSLTDTAEAKKYSTIKQDFVHDTHIGTKAVLEPNGVQANNLTDTLTSKSSTDSLQEAAISENKTDNWFNSMSQTGGNPTLDRIKLESREETSKKSTEPQDNSVVAVFKAFRTAFVKFWSQ